MAPCRLALLLLLLPGAVGCEGSRVVAPSPPDPDVAPAPGTFEAVFRTTPAETDKGIRGSGPLAVDFDMCLSRPARAGDALSFTFDFDADGIIDAVGGCRSRRAYTSPAVAMVCVSDGRAGRFACRIYRVEPTDEAQTLGATKAS